MELLYVFVEWYVYVVKFKSLALKTFLQCIARRTKRYLRLAMQHIFTNHFSNRLVWFHTHFGTEIEISLYLQVQRET